MEDLCKDGEHSCEYRDQSWWHYRSFEVVVVVVVVVTVTVVVVVVVVVVVAAAVVLVVVVAAAYGPGRPVRFAAHTQPLCWNSCTIHELFCL